MFRHRLHLRRWAARVLLLWLFGVACTLANACLASGSAPASDPVAAVQQPGAVPAQADAGCHGQQGAATRTACSDFCDKVRISIPLKSALDQASGHALPAAALALAVPAPAPIPVPRWLPRQQDDWAPPIPIVFLRLAL